MEIYVIINTNHAYKSTMIEEDAIYEFTTNGFMDGTYDAKVEFSCLPAAVDSNALEVILNIAKDVTEYGEMIVFYGTVCKHIVTFLKKCHGYRKTLEVNVSDSMSELIDISDNLTEVELEAIITSVL